MRASWRTDGANDIAANTACMQRRARRAPGVRQVREPSAGDADSDRGRLSRRCRFSRLAQRRPGAHAAHGLELLESVRLQRQRDADPPGHRRHCQQRDEGRRLRVRRHGRLLADDARRLGRDRRGPSTFRVRDEGPGRLCPQPRLEARALLRRRNSDLRQSTRQQVLRGGRCAPVRGLGSRLPQVRLVQHRWHDRAGGLRQDAPRPRRGRATDRLLDLRVGQQSAMALGTRYRTPLAHDRRHRRLLGLRTAVQPRLAEAARPAGRSRELRRAGRLERPGHAGGRQRRHDDRGVSRALQLVVPACRAAHGRQRRQRHVG